MNKYELVVVVKPTLDEDGIKAEFDKVNELITKFGGTIDNIDNWGKRRLAYEIAKQNDGIYNIISFTAPGTTPIEIESRIRIMENILRYLVIRVDA